MKQTPEQAADKAVSNHHDPEVRRMYGHYYRMFLKGQQWQKEKSDKEANDLADVLRIAMKSLATYGSHPLIEDYAKKALSNHENELTSNDTTNI